MITIINYYNNEGTINAWICLSNEEFNRAIKVLGDNIFDIFVYETTNIIEL